MTRQAILDRVRERIVERHIRFRSRPVDGSRWTEVPVDLSYHVRFTTLGRPTNLSAHLSAQVDGTLDPDRPLWQTEFISDSRGAVVSISFRIHHVIGDGLSMMLLLYSLLDDSVESDPYRDLPLGKKKIPLCMMFLYWIRVMMCLPFAILSLACMRKDRRNVLHHDPKATRLASKKSGVVHWSKPLSLRDVKRLRKRAKCSLNDCLSGVIAGALRRYFQDIGESVEHDITCVIPVSVRRMGSASLVINNQVSSVFLKLPISVADPVKRLKKLKKRMDALKYGATIWAVFILTHLLTLLPTRLGQYLNRSFMNRCSLLFSNVPGKSSASGVLGNKILGVLGIVPLYGQVGCGITCITYNGNAYVTVQSHPCMPRPELIVKYFTEEFDSLCEAHNLEPAFDDPSTQVRLHQCHAGWLSEPSERSDYMKGLVPPRTVANRIVASKRSELVGVPGEVGVQKSGTRFGVGAHGAEAV